jgi:hypothetical protein
MCENRSQHAQSPSRWGRRKYILLGALLAAAIGVAGLYYGQEDSRFEAMNSEAGSRSPAYLFGFAHAALTACNVSPGPGLDQLAAAVQRDPHGVLADDMKAGFAEFGRILQASGTAEACRQAEHFFGPHALPRPGVLLPR